MLQLQHRLLSSHSALRVVHRRLPRILASRPFHASSSRSAKVQKTFKLADIGEGITECEVIKWRVYPMNLSQDCRVY